MENFNSNNVNLPRRDAKSKQLYNEQRRGILPRLLQYMKDKEKLEHGVINKLIGCVQDAFNKLESNTLDNVFITLQKCMESIMLKGGGDSYKIPHIGKYGKTSS